MKRLVVAIVLLILMPLAGAETITYEIYELSEAAQSSRLIAKGVRQYTVKDIEVFPYQREGMSIAEKFIELEQGYSIGARIFYGRNLTGFGLLAKRSRGDFSWEWYSKATGNRFRKLQGGTYVIVKVDGPSGNEELVEVTFLDDTRLRFKAAGAENDTHGIIVKAGSILRLK